MDSVSLRVIFPLGAEKECILFIRRTVGQVSHSEVVFPWLASSLVTMSLLCFFASMYELCCSFDCVFCWWLILSLAMWLHPHWPPPPCLSRSSPTSEALPDPQGREMTVLEGLKTESCLLHTRGFLHNTCITSSTELHYSFPGNMFIHPGNWLKKNHNKIWERKKKLINFFIPRYVYTLYRSSPRICKHWDEQILYLTVWCRHTVKNIDWDMRAERRYW